MRGMTQALESAERIASLGTLEVEWESPGLANARNLQGPRRERRQWAAIREAWNLSRIH